MINIEFRMADGTRRMVYDVHPRSQEEGGIEIPDGATEFVIWMGTS